MSYINDITCASYFGTDNSQLCASGPSDVCNGDSGGDFIRIIYFLRLIYKILNIHKTFQGPINSYINSNWFVTGLTSWGYNCGSGSVFTRASFYKDWMITVNFKQLILVMNFKSY